MKEEGGVRLTTGELAAVIDVPYGTLAEWVGLGLVRPTETKQGKIARHFFGYDAAFIALLIAELRRQGIRPREASALVYDVAASLEKEGKGKLWQYQGLIVVLRPPVDARFDTEKVSAALDQRIAALKSGAPPESA